MRFENLKIKDIIQSHLDDEGMRVDAIELKTNDLPVQIASNANKAISDFEQDNDVIHYLVTIKKPKQAPSLSLDSLAPSDSVVPKQDSLDSLVNETISLTKSRAKSRESGAPQYSAKYLLDNARLLCDSGELELARNIYKTLVKEGDSIAEGLMGIGETYEKEANLIEAERHYREALAYSSASLIYQALIGTLIKQGKDQEACRYLIHASGLPGLTDEQRFDFHKSLGNCYARLGDLDRAAYQYEKAYELFPQSDTLQINVGSLALQKADYQSAKEHFEAALEANPKNEKAYNGLGMVYMSLGNMQKAHDHFVTALNFDPTNLGALNNLVKTSYELNQFQQAIHAIESYMNLKPESRNSTNILYCYCSILYHQGHLHTAKSEAERILSINPQHSGAKEILALIKSANQGR